MSLKYRLAIIVALCLASVWALFPRNVTEHVRVDGVLHDVVTRHVPLQKGLDLEGGTYLQLEVNDSLMPIAAAAKANAIDLALKTVRTRVEGFGVSEASVEKAGNDRIVVQIPGSADPTRAENLVKEQAFLEFQLTDETKALERVLPRFDQIIKEKGLASKTAGAAAPASTPAVTGIQGLLTGTDTSKADSAKKKATAKKDTAADSLKLAAGGAFSSLIQQGGMPGEYYVEQNQIPTLESYLSLPEIKAAIPPGRDIHEGTDTTFMGGKWYRPIYVVDSKPILTGDHLVDARPNQNTVDGTVVDFQLDNEAGRRFRTETGNHLGKYMAIVLDYRVMGRPPVIQGAISTHGQITMGGKDLAAAQDLALVLRAGSLPVPLRVAENRTIGPTLGKDSIDKGIRAIVIAMLLVVAIMLGYYRFSGLLAVGGLCLYVLYTLAVLAGFDAVLTLPGLAGFVLSIGIALDSNVLIFERIREEITRGKTVRTSIDEGFRHAMPAIVDSNVSTILTAAVLYQYGTGPVKGFAVTLIAGIIASLVTSIFVVRTFYMIWLTRARAAQTLSI